MWLTMVTPRWERSSLARVPAATRAAVSRAEARSRTSRASSKPYFSMPGRSACPGRGWVRTDGRAPGLGGHLLGPFRPLGVGDLDGHRRAQGAAVADAAGQGDLVGLEAHAGTAPVAEPASAQLIGDVGGLDRQAGRETFDGDDQGAAVRFAGGEIAQHALTLVDGYVGPPELGAGRPRSRRARRPLAASAGPTHPAGTAGRAGTPEAAVETLWSTRRHGMSAFSFTW